MRLKRRYQWLKHSLCLLLLLALPIFSRAADNDAFFKQGNAAYAKGEYQQAVQLYQQILNGGYQSATVYFNMGNAYYRLGDIPSALLYYEKAHKLAPGDEDINVNIRFANSKTTDKLEQAPEFFVTQWWHGIILFFSINALAVLSVAFLITGFLLLILYLFANSVLLKRSSFYTGILAVLSGLTFIFIANRQVYYFDSHHQAIIFSNSVTAKSTPDANGKPLFIVHEGTKVDVLQKNDEFMEVALPNGNAGWIALTDAKEI